MRSLRHRSLMRPCKPASKVSKLWASWSLRVSLTTMLACLVLGVFLRAGLLPDKASAETGLRMDFLVYVGKINETFGEKLQTHNGERRLVIASGGGYVEHAIVGAEILDQQDWSIAVVGFCSSACADIVLLGSSRIEFLPGSVVGFHGDSLMKNWLYKDTSGQVDSQCFLKHQPREDKLIRKRGINRAFWKEQIKRLRPARVRLRRDQGNCPGLFYDLEIDFWYPTSEQLRDLYGLKFTGTVASDTPNRFESSFTSLHKHGDSIMIGDRVFLVQEFNQTKSLKELIQD